MTDAREVVQPRWKRRANEIADAIGGGTSSVKLDGTPENSNTVDSLAAAIASALQLVTLHVNIKTYDDVNYGTAGMPIQQGYSAVNGNRLSFYVDQQGTLDVNLQEYGGASISTANPIDINLAKYGNTHVAALGNGLPVIHVGQTSPLPINITQYAGTNIGTTGIPIKQGHGAVTGNVLSFKVEEQNTVPVDIQKINATNFTGTSISVTESNPVSGGGGTVNFPSTMAVTGTVSVDNHPTPVTTVAVSNHPTTMSVTGAVDVNNHPTSTAITGTVPVTLPVDASNVTLPLAVTETNPVSGSGGTVNFPSTMAVTGTVSVDNHPTPVTTVAVSNHPTTMSVTGAVDVNNHPSVQDVKVVGDETYGIIMSKNAPIRVSGTQTNTTVPYLTEHWGLVGGVAVNQVTHLVSNGDDYNTGWIIRVNGVDIYNQDITHGITGNNYNLIGATPSNAAQSIIDKYHGRKVTLSSVANVWTIQPVFDTTLRLGYITDIANISGIDIHAVTTDDGTIYTLQRVFDDGAWITYSGHNKYVGARVVKRIDNGYSGNHGWIVSYVDAT